MCLFNLAITDIFELDGSIAVGSVFLFIIGFSISLGPILSVYLAETLNNSGI